MEPFRVGGSAPHINNCVFTTFGDIRRPLWGHQASGIPLFSSCPSFFLPLDVADCRLAFPPPGRKTVKSLRLALGPS